MSFNGVLDPPRKTVAAAFLVLAPLTGIQAPPAQISPQGGEAMISIDTPAVNMTVGKDVPTTISGWAAGAGPGTGIQRVDVYLGPPASGTHLGTANYGLPRTDVAAAFGRPEWTNSGFALEWDPRNVAAGEHVVYVVARAASGYPVASSVSFSVLDAPERNCSMVRPCYLWRDSAGWWIDTGSIAVTRDNYFEPRDGR